MALVGRPLICTRPSRSKWSSMKFLKDYWYIPLFVIALVLGWVVFRRRGGTPIAQIKRELDAIEAQRHARELVARLGADKARVRVIVRHREAMEALDEKQRVQAESLRADPVKLAKFLTKAGSDYR